MAGIAGFEPTMPESESGALPLGDIPLWELNGVNDGTRTHDNQNHNLALYQLNYVHHNGAS